MIRRIVITLQEGVRIVLHPAGGLDVERHVPGVGWCLETEGVNPSNTELCNLLGDARSIIEHVAQDFEFSRGNPDLADVQPELFF